VKRLAGLGALALVALVGALAVPGVPAGGAQATITFAEAGDQAVATLLHVYYAGNGLWNECDQPGCPQVNTDWGADSLTYALYLRWQSTGDPSVVPVMSALLGTSPTYPSPCMLPTCQSWSDVPNWDAIAALREYAVLGKDPQALAKGEAAFSFVADATAYALGACAKIPYQQPSGGANQLKTLETEGNAIKAAILLYQATGDQTYLTSAVADYAAVRASFLDPVVPLYSVYVFDDGQACTQLPHRFFASVNGDMIWSGLELSQITGTQQYLTDALATARAVATDLADPAGVFSDLQAENDVVEPLVEAMYDLATEASAPFARAWILTNAAAALSDRTADGSFGRFFDGPPPRTTVTAWQTVGGLALEIAAAALDPSGTVPTTGRWAGARPVARSIGPTGKLTFTGAGIAFLGTLGEVCCEAGHARVFVDGRETFDQTGIWQNKSSLGRKIPETVLFAWRWPKPGTHTIRFEPGSPNAKEGGTFLHIRSYVLLR
jgi:hypothetical protein